MGDDGWHAAADGEGEDFYDGLSAEEILNTEFPDYTNYNDKRTIDQIIAAAGTEKGAAASAAENGEVNLEMDMNMDPIQYESEYGKGNGFTSARMASSNNFWPKKERLAGTGLEHENWRWPKNIIPYKIAPQYTEDERKTIYSGMKMWMRKTCIEFEPAGSAKAKSTGHNNFLYIFSGDGCYSRVGYQAHLRPQPLSLQKYICSRGMCDGCMQPATVAHELGHAIGLHHEQTREDRDNYLQVLENNIIPDQRFNFEKQEGYSTFGTPYDYCSVMHYGATAFGLRPEYLTMIPKDLGYISVSLHLHTTSNSANGFTSRDVSYVDKSIVERSIDVSHTKYKLSLTNLRSKGNLNLLLNFLLSLTRCHLLSLVEVNQAILSW